MRALSLALLFLFASASPARATVLADWSLEEVVRRGDSVVIGTVRSQRTVLDEDGERHLETDIEVSEVLLGAPLVTLTLSQIGGDDGDIRTEAVGDARLVPGERVLLVTFAHQDGRRYLVGMGLGALHLDNDGELLRQEVDASLIDSEGRVSPPPGERRFRTDDVRAIVRHRATRSPATRDGAWRRGAR